MLRLASRGAAAAATTSTRRSCCELDGDDTAARKQRMLVAVVRFPLAFVGLRMRRQTMVANERLNEPTNERGAPHVRNVDHNNSVVVDDDHELVVVENKSY
jgi:hypothetical protein